MPYIIPKPFQKTNVCPTCGAIPELYFGDWTPHPPEECNA